VPDAEVADVRACGPVRASRGRSRTGRARSLERRTANSGGDGRERPEYVPDVSGTCS
jgi:hypothetical protein